MIEDNVEYVPLEQLPAITAIHQVYVVWQALIPGEPLAGCGFHHEAWPIDFHGLTRIRAQIIEKIHLDVFIPRIKDGKPVPSLADHQIVVTFICEGRDHLEGAPNMDALEKAPGR